MVNILVLGASGMAGHLVYYFLKEKNIYEINNIVFRTPITSDSIIVDVMDKVLLEETIKKTKPDIIINCIGILIKGSYNSSANAIYINSYLPHLLKQIADKMEAKLIHISTDCVFSGKKGNYTELDIRDADDIYGRSKALGEILNDKDLTIRTSIIGPELRKEGEGLFHWFMNQGGSVNGFKNAIWGGVTTLELAKAIHYAIENNTIGLVHLSNGIGISKFDLLALFNDIWNKKIQINPFECEYIDKSIAKSLSFHYEVPSYKEMISDLHDWMINHQSLYKKIYSL